MEAALKAAGFRVAPHWPAGILPQINQLRNWYANLNTPNFKFTPQTHQVMLRPSSKTGHYINVFYREIAPAGTRAYKWNHLESIKTPAEQKLVNLFKKPQTSVSRFDKTQAWTKQPTTLVDSSSNNRQRVHPGNVQSVINQSVQSNLFNLINLSSPNPVVTSTQGSGTAPSTPTVTTAQNSASQNLQNDPDGIFSCTNSQ